MSKAAAAINQKGKTTSVQIDPRYIARLTGTLLGICAIVALLLGIVNLVTEPIITRMQEERTAAAMRQVLSAENYEAVEVSQKNVLALYRAVSGGKQVGFVAEVTSGGFGGAMTLVVGVDMDGKVTGVAVTKHAETKNIGSKVADDSAVLERFAGMSGEITVNSGENRFDAVTGATVTSKAVTAAVNTALSAAAAAGN